MKQIQKEMPKMSSFKTKEHITDKKLSKKFLHEEHNRNSKKNEKQQMQLVLLIKFI